VKSVFGVVFSCMNIPRLYVISSL